MARYIDADKLERDLRLERSSFECKYGSQNDPLSFGGALKRMEHLVRMINTEDVAPIRFGKWLMDSDSGDTVLSCSLCDEHYWIERDGDKKPNYCPNCGAKMTDGDTP